jgi:tetratricopeptide (TPR) repeat protein
MRVHFSFFRAALTVACSLFLTSMGLAQDESSSTVKNSSLNALLFYQLLIGEMEFRSGKPQSAFELMLDAARKSRDEALFLRASNMALQMRDGAKTSNAVQAWRQTLPKSFEASRYEVQVLVALHRTPELLPAIGHLIELTPAKERVSVINSLPPLLNRGADKKQTAQGLEPVLKPWLKDVSTRMAAQLALGRMWLSAEQPEQTLAFAQRAQTQNPQAQEPAVLALELLSSPVHAPAEAIIKNFLKTQPSAGIFRVVYARALGSQQRYTDAVEQLNVVNQADPRMAAPWLALGALHLELKQPAQTTKLLETYLKRLASGGITANTPTALPDSDDDMGSEASSPQAQTNQAYFLLSKAAEQQRDYVVAQTWLDKITDPQRAMDVLLRRASMMAEQGQLDKALDMVRKAPDTTPDAPRDKINIEAQLLTNAKKWAAAEAVLAKANQRFPNDADMLYQQAMMAEKLNRIDDMEQLLKRVMDIRPDHFHAYNALGYSLAERNLRLPEAKKLIAKALSLAPSEPFITDSLGWVEYRLGNLDEAVKLLKEAYRLRPDVEIAVHLGEVLWAKNQRDEARRVLREANAKDAANDVLREALTRLKVDL